MIKPLSILTATLVALLAEGVDRNEVNAPAHTGRGTVALLAEGVDRNGNG